MTPLHESPGTIAIPTSETGRFTLFTVSLAGTRQPGGTNIDVRASASVTENINGVFRALRDEDEWVWVLGDDHVWPGHTLMALLEISDYHDCDILVPLVVKRNPPWNFVLFHSAGVYEGGELDGMPRWKPWEWTEVPETGTFKVDAAGSAGMLIRKRVLDAMADPWMESTQGSILNEDVNFCRKAAELGFQTWATADVTMGHLGIFNVRPVYKDGQWRALTEFSSPEEQYRHIYMPFGEAPEAVAGAR